MCTDDLWREISLLAKKRQYSLVEEKCNELLKSDLSVDFNSQVLRLRSSNYIFLKDYLSAYVDRLAIFDHGQSEVSDYFFAALYAANLQRESDALGLIDKGILACKETKEFYYLDSFVFLKAFCLIKVERYSDASSILSNVADGFKLWITRPDKPHSKEELLEIISYNV